MKVIIGKDVYDLSENMSRATIETAKKLLRDSIVIYATEKNGVVEMKNETYESNEKLKDAVLDYEKEGFKVHYNALLE